jgi:hypothetical protein
VGHSVINRACALPEHRQYVPRVVTERQRGTARQVKHQQYVPCVVTERQRGTARQVKHQRYVPRVVTERQRGTAKNSVSVSLSVIFFSC